MSHNARLASLVEFSFLGRRSAPELIFQLLDVVLEEFLDIRFSRICAHCVSATYYRRRAKCISAKVNGVTNSRCLYLPSRMDLYHIVYPELSYGQPLQLDGM
jgi:hypothetical protein